MTKPKTRKPSPKQQAITEIRKALPVLDSDSAKIRDEIKADIKTNRKKFFQEIGRLGGLAKARKETKWQDKFPKLAFNMARLGCRDEDIANMFGVGKSTFSEWKNSRPALGEALKKARAHRNLALVGSALELAVSGNPAATGSLIFLLKNWMGMTDKADVIHSGEVGIIYKSNIPQAEGAEKPDDGSILPKKGPKSSGRGSVSD